MCRQKNYRKMFFQLGKFTWMPSQVGRNNSECDCETHTNKQTTFNQVVYAAISTETHQKMPNLGEILDEETQATRAVESARNEPHKNEIKSDQQNR